MKRSGVFYIDLANGVLKAENIDTYWSRRGRFYVKGTIDKEESKFSAITDIEAVHVNFDYQTGLYGEVASVKGTADAGFLYQSGQYSCNAGKADCGITASGVEVSLATSKCLPATKSCTGNSGYTWDKASALGNFLQVGAAWDGVSSNRTALQNWLIDAEGLDFTSVVLTNVPD